MNRRAFITSLLIGSASARTIVAATMASKTEPRMTATEITQRTEEWEEYLERLFAVAPHPRNECFIYVSAESKSDLLNYIKNVPKPI
jgi:hypothetical protein